jgi:hypothetical protein
MVTASTMRLAIAMAEVLCGKRRMSNRGRTIQVPD